LWLAAHSNVKKDNQDNGAGTNAHLPSLELGA